MIFDRLSIGLTFIDAYIDLHFVGSLLRFDVYKTDKRNANYYLPLEDPEISTLKYNRNKLFRKLKH